MSEHSDNHSHFVVPLKYYVGTFVALLILTVVTVAAAQIDLGGALNIILAMLIAVIKAALVVMFFMGMRWESGFNRLAFVGCLLFVLIFVGFTLGDVLTRGGADEREKGHFGIKSPVKVIQPGEDPHHKDIHH